MSHFFHALLRLLFHLGYFGPLVLGTLDSSFLILPIGNDLLVIALVARHHDAYLIYVLSAVCGSTLGVLLLDLAARRIGEQGVQKMAGQRKWERLKRKIGTRGAAAVALAAIAPPPFPFTLVVASVCALGYSRWKLLLSVAAARCLRFLIIGYLAIKFGTVILSVMRSSGFKWTMVAFAAICIVGSAASIMKWLRAERPRPKAAAAAA